MPESRHLQVYRTTSTYGLDNCISSNLIKMRPFWDTNKIPISSRLQNQVLPIRPIIWQHSEVRPFEAPGTNRSAADLKMMKSPKIRITVSTSKHIPSLSSPQFLALILYQISRSCFHPWSINQIDVSNNKLVSRWLCLDMMGKECSLLYMQNLRFPAEIRTWCPSFNCFVPSVRILHPPLPCDLRLGR